MMLNTVLHSEKTGYYAWEQAVYPLQDDEWIEENNKSNVTFLTDNLEVVSVEASNTAWGDFGAKPYVIDAEFTSSEFLEKAGNKYLFKVGELIGPQMDLYQEDDERTLPVEESFCRKYVRTIEFGIPKGYNCDNLSDLNN